ILAILIIIALPNILKMFNNAKSDVFVNEVKTVASSAEKEFISLQMSGESETVFCRSENGSINPLSMSGAEKYYYVKLNKEGRIKYVVVWDDEKYIRYKYSLSNPITNLDKSDIVTNDNYGISCDNIVDEFNLNSNVNINDVNLLVTTSVRYVENVFNVQIRLENSEDLDESITYRIYRKPEGYDDSYFELIKQVTRHNSSEEYSYIYEDNVREDEVYGICSGETPVYLIEVLNSNLEVVKDTVVYLDINC
ncbi:MAG: hypothetical protein GX758_00495, partial [Tenericutes bacterium]|nr:hypothetical protein [Mycoplasmatota bacterium]